MRVSREFKGDEQPIPGGGRTKFVMRWRESCQARLGTPNCGAGLRKSHASASTTSGSGSAASSPSPSRPDVLNAVPPVTKRKSRLTDRRPVLSTRPSVAKATLCGSGCIVWSRLHEPEPGATGKPVRPDGRGRPRGAGRSPARRAGLPAVRRTRGDRLDRLHGPRQLRHQHPGRRPVRLPSALGRRAGQSGRDAVPGALGQARHRHRPEPGATLPDAFPPPAGLRHVDRQRGGGDGDRPRRIARRRHRPEPAVRPAAADRPADHLRRDLHPAAAAGTRLPADRDGDRGVHRRDRRLLPDRAVRRPARLARLRLPRRGAANSPDRTASCWRSASSARP